MQLPNFDLYKTGSPAVGRRIHVDSLITVDNMTISFSSETDINRPTIYYRKIHIQKKYVCQSVHTAASILMEQRKLKIQYEPTIQY